MQPLRPVGSSEQSSSPKTPKYSSPREDGSSSNSEQNGEYAFFMQRPDHEFGREGHPIRTELTLTKGYYIFKVQRTQGIQGESQPNQTVLKIVEPTCVQGLTLKRRFWIKLQEGPAGVLVKNPHNGKIERVNVASKDSYPEHCLSEAAFIDFFQSHFKGVSSYLPRPERDYWDGVHPLQKWLTDLSERVAEQKKLIKEKAKIEEEKKEFQKKLSKPLTPADSKEIVKRLEEEAESLNARAKYTLQLIAAYRADIKVLAAQIWVKERITLLVQNRDRAAQSSEEAVSEELYQLLTFELQEAGEEVQFSYDLAKGMKETDDKARSAEPDYYYAGKEKLHFSITRLRKIRWEEITAEDAARKEKLKEQIKKLRGNSPARNLELLIAFYTAKINEQQAWMHEVNKLSEKLQMLVAAAEKEYERIEGRKLEILDKKMAILSGSSSILQQEFFKVYQPQLAEKERESVEKQKALQALAQEIEEKQKFVKQMNSTQKQQIALGSFIIQAGPVLEGDLQKPLTRLAGVAKQNLHHYLIIEEPSFLKGIIINRGDWIACSAKPRPLGKGEYWRLIRDLEPHQPLPGAQEGAFRLGK